MPWLPLGVVWRGARQRGGSGARLARSGRVPKALGTATLSAPFSSAAAPPLHVRSPVARRPTLCRPPLLAAVVAQVWEQVSPRLSDKPQVLEWLRVNTRPLKEQLGQQP